jgi:hypothetical protein
MKVLLVTGVIGSGKDFFAHEYKKNHPEENVEIIRFATPLRNICAKLYNFDANDDIAYEKFKIENRRFMVELGQSMKDELGQELFAKEVVKKLLVREVEDVTFIIPDFRFPIEYLYMLSDFDIKVVFCNYHSDKYKIIPDQTSEQMAIWMINNGFRNRQEFYREDFYRILNYYENNFGN